VQQKRTGGGKITKIILLFYCILILSLAFDENSRGVHNKSKTLKQHDDRSVVIHLKIFFIFIFMLYINVPIPSFFKVCRITHRYPYLCIIGSNIGRSQDSQLHITRLPTHLHFYNVSA